MQIFLDIVNEMIMAIGSLTCIVISLILIIGGKIEIRIGKEKKNKL